jgi:hypothetical protein
MSEIQNTAKTILTEEEKKQKKREYMRVYMANKRATDTDFADKQREIVRNRQKTKYHDESTNYRKNQLEYHIHYYQKFKDAYKEARAIAKLA